MREFRALITFCLSFGFFTLTAETGEAAPIMEISVEIVKSNHPIIQPKAVRAEAGTEAFREALEQAQDRADYIRKNYDDIQVHVEVAALAQILVEDKNGDVIMSSEVLKKGTEEFQDTLADAREWADYYSGKYGKLFVRIEMVEAEQPAP